MTQVNLRNLVQLDETAKFMKQGMTIEKALTILNRQMKVSGLRERTIKDYKLSLIFWDSHIFGLLPFSIILFYYMNSQTLMMV